MNDSSIPRRYAKALFELVLEGGKYSSREEGREVLDRTGAELALLAEAISDTPELRAWLKAPGAAAGVAGAEHPAERVLLALLSPGSLVERAVRLLAARRRLEHLPAISLAFRALVDEHLGRVRASLTSAVPLSEAEVERLRRALMEATQVEVELSQQTEPSLLAGIVAQVGSRRFDGSVRAQLDALKRHLKE